MTCVQESFFISRLLWLLNVFVRAWHNSGIYTAGSRLFSALGRLFSDSAVTQFFAREGVLSRGFRSSVLVGFAQWLLNLPARLLGWIYRRFQPLWDGSVLLNFIHTCCESSYAVFSWLLLILLVTPQELWNNMYSTLAACLVLLMFVVAGARRRGFTLELKAMGIYTVMFAAFAVLSYLLSDYRELSTRFLVFHMTSMLAVLLCVSAIDDEEKLWRVIGFALAGCTLAALYAVAQRAMGLEVDEKLVDISVNADTPGRVFSFFENPNSFAMILVMLLPVSLVTAISKPGLLRALGCICFVVALAALLMTYSRGAWVGFAFSMCVLIILLRPALLPLFVIAGLLILPLLPESIYNRILSSFNTSDTSISSRKPVYEATAKLIQDKPLWGYGLGSDAIKEAIEDSRRYRGLSPFIHAHNIYLQIWAEMGVFGLASFIAAMFCGFKNGARAIHRKLGSGPLRCLIAALIAGVSGVLVCGIVDYPWSYPRIMLLFWIVFGLLLCGIRLANAPQKDGDAA